jgi:fructosamine-3-kinase
MSLPSGAREARRIGGGDINEAFRVALADGSDAFVKTRADACTGEYAAEAAGLAWLAEPGALRTPRVLDVDDAYLALEWVEPGRLDAAGVEELGRGLAATHSAGARSFGAVGGERSGHGETDAGLEGGSPEGDVGASGPSRFGSLRLPNEPTDDWPTFYAQRRLRPLARLAHDRNALSASGIHAVEQVCERIADLSGPHEPPARLHGDLWSGNVMADPAGRPWLIDPSAYGGHREVDLAMLRLFGAPSDDVFAAYREVAPLAGGWEERVELYQLLPLLVHALLFGGSYRAAAERVAMRYAR